MITPGSFRTTRWARSRVAENHHSRTGPRRSPMPRSQASSSNTGSAGLPCSCRATAAVRLDDCESSTPDHCSSFAQPFLIRSSNFVILPSDCLGRIPARGRYAEGQREVRQLHSKYLLGNEPVGREDLTTIQKARHTARIAGRESSRKQRKNRNGLLAYSALKKSRSSGGEN